MENTYHIPHDEEREQEISPGSPQNHAQSKGEQTLLFDPISRATLWERTKYTASTALTVGGLAELIGFGGLSVLLGAAGGVVGYLFSDELHDFVLNHLPAPQAARRSRKSRAYWWLTGETLPDNESEEEAEDTEDEDRDEQANEHPPSRSRRTARPGPRTPSADELPAEHVQLAPTLALPIDEVSGKAIFIVGMRRSGKTTLGVRIAEELAGHYIPLLWPDLEGDCLSMVEMLPRGKVAGHPSSSRLHAPFAGVFESVTVDNAHLLGSTILADGWQVVLDLGSYPSVEEACQVTVNVIGGVFAWANAHPDLQVPCLIVLDEAQRFLPERLADSIIQDKGVLESLLKAYMDIIAVGGKRGISPMILTQRFAQVNKKIMAQSELFFILRQTMDKDLERCMEFVKKSTATEEDISQFRQGEGVYIGPGGEQLVTQFFKRHSDGSRSHTPKAEAAHRYAQMPMRRGVDGASSQAPNQEADPSVAAPSAPKAAPSLFERGVHAYLEGATTQPKLATALGISPWEARMLMPQVQAEVKRREDARQDTPLDEEPEA